MKYLICIFLFTNISFASSDIEVACNKIDTGSEEFLKNRSKICTCYAKAMESSFVKGEKEILLDFLTGKLNVDEFVKNHERLANWETAVTESCIADTNYEYKKGNGPVPYKSGETDSAPKKFPASVKTEDE